mmetsp:Transcript_20223/g.56360  ORF Transcript_20223/g.56360 Transcript_20223/m.56360 type:complete len:97 (-) Transcript_20223:1275-1565(-)
MNHDYSSDLRIATERLPPSHFVDATLFFALPHSFAHQSLALASTSLSTSADTIGQSIFVGFVASACSLPLLPTTLAHYSDSVFVEARAKLLLALLL